MVQYNDLRKLRESLGCTYRDLRLAEIQKDRIPDPKPRVQPRVKMRPRAKPLSDAQLVKRRRFVPPLVEKALVTISKGAEQGLTYMIPAAGLDRGEQFKALHSMAKHYGLRASDRGTDGFAVWKP